MFLSASGSVTFWKESLVALVVGSQLTTSFTHCLFTAFLTVRTLPRVASQSRSLQAPCAFSL